MSSLWLLENVTQSFAFYATVTDLSIEDERPCQVATARFTIEDPGDALTFKVHDVIRSSFDSTLIFAGDVTKYGIADITGQGPVVKYQLDVRDFTPRLKRNVVTANPPAGLTVTDLVEWIMAYCDKRISTLGVESNSTVLDAPETKGLSVLAALDLVASEIGASYYVTFETAGDPLDFDGDLQFFTTWAMDAAPFDLRSSQSGSWDPDTDPPISNAGNEVDAEDHVTKIFVSGDGVATWVEDTVATAAWASSVPGGGALEDAIVDPNIKTEAQATNVGTAALALRKDPRISARARVYQPGLQPMQKIHYDHPQLKVNGTPTDADYCIQKVSIGFISLTALFADVELADRFSPCKERSANLAQAATNTTDCSQCTAKMAQLPSGFEDGNVIMARRKVSGIHVYNGTKLYGYNCDLTVARHNDAVATAIDRIYHEPGTDTPLIGGDAGIYTDPDIGPYGEFRWSNGGTPTAAEVQDRARFWVDGGQSTLIRDTFGRTVAASAVGTADTGQDWDASSGTFVTNGATQEVDGSRYKFLGGAALNRGSAQFMVDSSGIGSDDFTVTGKWTPTYSPNVSVGGPGDDDGYLQIFHSAWPQFIIEVGESGPTRSIQVSGNASSDSDTTTVLSSGTTYRFRWEHRQSTGLSRARVWADGDPEPGTWNVSRSFTPSNEPITGSPSDGFGVFHNSTPGLDSAYLDDLVVASGETALEVRDASTGGLVNSVGLTMNAGIAVRRTPNGQHLYVIYADAASEMEKYSRAPALEDTTSGSWGFDFTADPTFIDWNADDAGFIYALWDDGTGAASLQKYSYPAISTAPPGFQVDIGSLYGFRSQTLQPVGGNGQQVFTGRSSGGNDADQYVRLVGYIGEADWTDGSKAIVMTFRMSDGGLVNTQEWDTADAAQAIGIVSSGGCLFVVIVAEGGSFEGVALSGRTAFVRRLARVS